jgi:hypothetical protein
MNKELIRAAKHGDTEMTKQLVAKALEREMLT